MPKTLDGTTRGNFDDLQVADDGVIEGDLTVKGVFTGGGGAPVPTTQTSFTATDTTNQYRVNSGTFDLKSTTVANPIIRFRGNTDLTTATVLLAGRLDGECTDGTSVQYTTQKNATTGTGGGAGLKVETDASRKLEMIMYNSLHSILPSRALLKSTGATEFIIDTDVTTTPIKFKIAGVDKFTISDTAVTTSLPYTVGTLSASTLTLTEPTLKALAISSNQTSSSTITGSITTPGGVGIGGNLYLGGTLNVTGVTTLNSTLAVSGTLTVPIVNINGTGTTLTVTSPLASTTTGNGAVVITGGVGIGGALNVGGLTKTTTFNVTSTSTNTNVFSVTGSAGSVSTLTGSATFAGGVGIDKELNVRGPLVVSTLTPSTNAFRVDNTSATASPTTGSAVFLGGVGINGDVRLGGRLIVSNTTPSTSASTGSAVFSGGVGIAGDLNVTGAVTGGSITYTSTDTGTMTITNTPGTTLTVNSLEPSTSSTTGAVKVLGGMGIGGSLYVQGTINAASVSAGTITYSTASAADFSVTGPVLNTFRVLSLGSSVSTISGAATFAGGVGIDKELNVRGPLVVSTLTPSTNAFRVDNTSITASPTTGSGVFMGGVGINGDLQLGGRLLARNTTVSTSAITGSIVVSGTGGIGVGGDLYAGGIVSSPTGNFTNVNVSNFLDITNPINNSLTVRSVEDSSGPSTGSAIFFGGIGVVKSIRCGSAIHCVGLVNTSTTPSTGPGNGSATFAGGVGINGGLYVNSNVTASLGVFTTLNAATLLSVNAGTGTTFTVSSVDQSTIPTDGSATFAGGVGISKNLNVGGNLNVTGTLGTSGSTTFSGTTTFTGNVVNTGTSMSVRTLNITNTTGNTFSVQSTTNVGAGTPSATFMGGVNVAKDMTVGGTIAFGGYPAFSYMEGTWVPDIFFFDDVDGYYDDTNHPGYSTNGPIITGYYCKWYKMGNVMTLKFDISYRYTDGAYPAAQVGLDGFQSITNPLGFIPPTFNFSPTAGSASTPMDISNSNLATNIGGGGATKPFNANMIFQPIAALGGNRWMIRFSGSNGVYHVPKSDGAFSQLTNQRVSATLVYTLT